MATLSLEHIMRRVFEGHGNIIVQNVWGTATAHERRWKWGIFPYSVKIAEIELTKTAFGITIFHDNESLGIFMEEKIRKMIELNGRELVTYYA